MSQYIMNSNFVIAYESSLWSGKQQLPYFLIFEDGRSDTPVLAYLPASLSDAKIREACALLGWECCDVQRREVEAGAEAEELPSFAAVQALLDHMTRKAERLTSDEEREQMIDRLDSYGELGREMFPQSPIDALACAIGCLSDNAWDMRDTSSIEEICKHIGGML